MVVTAFLVDPKSKVEDKGYDKAYQECERRWVPSELTQIEVGKGERRKREKVLCILASANLWPRLSLREGIPG